MFKAIVYDFDGTLVNSLPLHIKAYQEALEKFGLNVIEEDVKKKCINVRNQQISDTFGINVGLFSKYYETAWVEKIKWVKLFPEVLETLKELGSYKLGICSLQPFYNLNRFVDSLRLRKYFKAIVGGKTPFQPKDVLFKEICELLGVSPCDTIIIGDS